MRNIYYYFSLLSLLSISLSCSESERNTQEAFRLGSLSGFAELVNSGTKQLALSSPLSPAEMDAFFPKAKIEADKYQVQLYREKDLLRTDLFPENVALNKEVLLLYQGTTLDEYEQLKADKKALVEQNAYKGEARTSIARRFGRLLSYTSAGMNKLLAQQTAFRSMADFGIEASNVFLYYKDLNRATQFYKETLGLELLADYQMATIFRLANDSYLILVDESKGMHSAEEPKTVALALLTEQLDEWWEYLNQEKVEIKYGYKPKVGGAHDGFVAIDPEGYLLEFERFKQHPENERFVPLLNKNTTIPSQNAKGKFPKGMGFHSSITWLYYKDMLGMQQFYEETLGLTLVADQGWTKIYQVSSGGFIGLVDECRGMHSFSEKKAVNISFLLEDLEGYFNYVKAQAPFTLRSEKLETGPEGKYKAFVGYDPGMYYMEFDKFFNHKDNQQLKKYIDEK